MHKVINSDFRIRSVQPKDGSAVVAFLKSVYGNWGNIDHWQWKYLEPPAPFRFDSIIAESDGRIIGHYGLLPVEAVHDNQEVFAAQGTDAAISAEFRRKGVYTALADEILKRAIDRGVKFIYAFPGLYALDVNVQHGYRSVGFVPELTCLINLPKALIRTIRNLPEVIGGLSSQIKGKQLTYLQTKSLIRFYRSMNFLASFMTSPNLTRTGRFSAPPDKVVVNPISHFDDRFDVLWGKLARKIPLGLCKHAKYLNWRYFSSPSNHYQVYDMQIDDNLAGCLVMRNEGVRSEIAEFLLLPEYSNAADTLLSTALSQARKNKQVSLHIWANQMHPFYKNLCRAGFVSPFRLQKLAGHNQRLSKYFYQLIIFMKHLSSTQQDQISSRIEAWQLSKGDSDLI